MDTSAGSDGASVRPAQVVLEQDPLLFELSAMLREESARFQQHGSNSMSVALQAADGMEFLVHFARCHAGVEVHVRCEVLDFERLKAFWPSLGEAMAPRLQVAPLRAPDRVASPAIRVQAGAARRFRRPGWQKSA
jgi:hypothetical protein